MKGKKVEKNVSVEKIGWRAGAAGAYAATHCKNDLFNAVFGCTPCMHAFFKGSTKYHLKAGNKDDWIRSQVRTLVAFNANLILGSQCLKITKKCLIWV